MRKLYPRVFRMSNTVVLLVCSIVLSVNCHLQAQQIDLGNLKTYTQKPVRVGGGLSASTVFYDGNDGQNRQPFTYFLNGNINVNLFSQVNLPFSFNITNLGTNYGYPTLLKNAQHPIVIMRIQ